MGNKNNKWRKLPPLVVSCCDVAQVAGCNGFTDVVDTGAAALWFWPEDGIANVDGWMIPFDFWGEATVGWKPDEGWGSPFGFCGEDVKPAGSWKAGVWLGNEKGWLDPLDVCCENGDAAGGCVAGDTPNVKLLVCILTSKKKKEKNQQMRSDNGGPEEMSTGQFPSSL